MSRRTARTAPQEQRRHLRFHSLGPRRLRLPATSSAFSQATTPFPARFNPLTAAIQTHGSPLPVTALGLLTSCGLPVRAHPTKTCSTCIAPASRMAPATLNSRDSLWTDRTSLKPASSVKAHITSSTSTTPSRTWDHPELRAFSAITRLPTTTLSITTVTTKDGPAEFPSTVVNGSIITMGFTTSFPTISSPAPTMAQPTILMGMGSSWI